MLAAGLVAGLWWGWAYALDRRLTSPVEQPGDSRPVKESGWVDRIFPETPAGGVAARTLRYWRRDPRYLAGVAGFLVGPVILIVLQLINPMANGLVAVFAPTLVGLLVGLSLAQDLSYDGSALWLHVGSGLRGADDRAGRAWSALVIFLPMIVILLLVSLVITGSWALAAPAAALALGSAFAGLGVGSVVGALWQWPAPPPGANPFAEQQPGRAAVAAQRHGHHPSRTLLVSLPTLGPGRLVDLHPLGGRLALVVGLASGLVVFKVGIGWGGRLLERRWPEALQAVSEKRLRLASASADQRRTRKPLAEAARSHGVPLVGQPALQGVRAQVLGHHEPRDPGGGEPGQPGEQQLVQGVLADPDRRVGPDLVVARLRVDLPPVAAPGPGRPPRAARALSRQSASARSLTSTASTVAPGQARAMASAIGPYPQPRSSTRGVPVGGCDSRSSTAVPRSRPSPANTPPAVSRVISRPQIDRA